MNFATLPSLIALAILVAVFWAISRKATGPQVRLWLIGWILILLHFVGEFPRFNEGLGDQLATAVALDSLVLASVAFLISISAVSDRRRQVQLAVAFALPALAYVNGDIWAVSNPKYYYFLIAIGPLAPLLLFCRFTKHGVLHVAGAVLATSVAAFVTVWAVARGHPEVGTIVILAALDFATAVLYWNHRPRATAGVLTAVGGFILWGAVFPTAMLLQIFLPAVKVDSEVWNIPKYLVAVGMILTLLEEQIDKSTYLAYHDELTELPNRRLLEDRLEQALAQANRAGSKVAVFVLDLDHFKEVNDAYGHRVGDLALREVVARLARRIRACDTLARSGGDEFTVVSHVASRPAARTLLSDLESALSDPITVEGKAVQTGLSIGLALFPEDGEGPDQLYAAADRAMYVAKRAGRSPEAVGALPQASL